VLKPLLYHSERRDLSMSPDQKTYNNLRCTISDIHANRVVKYIDAVHCGFEDINHNPLKPLVDWILGLPFKGPPKNWSNI
jgi:hypothetical protein